MATIRRMADHIVDTSEMTVHELRHVFTGVAGGRAPGAQLVVTILSFGFKHGIPVDSDLLFDVRFLPNPHFVPELRPHTGRDPQVLEYLDRAEATHEFLEHTLAEQPATTQCVRVLAQFAHGERLLGHAQGRGHGRAHVDGERQQVAQRLHLEQQSLFARCVQGTGEDLRVDHRHRDRGLHGRHCFDFRRRRRLPDQRRVGYHGGEYAPQRKPDGSWNGWQPGTSGGGHQHTEVDGGWG